MANEITTINTVSKKERNGIFVYHFPLAVIEANPATDTMRIIDNDRGQNHFVAFADITNTFETSNIVEYCDALAAGGYYFIPVGDGGAADLAAIETNTENTATSTASIDTKATTIATNTGNTATSTSATAVSAASIDTKATTIATNTGNTATNTATAASLLQGFETNGIPLRGGYGTQFSVTDRAVASITGAAAGSNRLTHLFRVKAGSGTVAIPSFLFSFQSITNDDFAIEVSLSPTLSAAVTGAMFVDVHASSKIQMLRPNVAGAPAVLTITGYDPTVGGRLLLSKYGRQMEVVDSSLLTKVQIPDNPLVTYAVSVVAMSASMDLRGIVNWSEQ